MMTGHPVSTTPAVGDLDTAPRGLPHPAVLETAWRSGVSEASCVERSGQVTEVTGTLIRACVPGVSLGELCDMSPPASGMPPCCVVGLAEDAAVLMPMGDLKGVSRHTRIRATGAFFTMAVHENLLGRVLDGLGRPLDGDPISEPPGTARYPVMRAPPPPTARKRSRRPFLTGVRAIDGVLTCAAGQRMGLFAAAGGGKTTLLGLIMQGAQSDVIVVALIGERGRELRDLIDDVLGAETLRKTVIVCATSDRSAMERVTAAHIATTVAEFFRDSGRQVLLVMDSVTRYARAQREIALAAGEPPARRGFPPSVFALLPQLLERAGPGEGQGSITAFYTVLVEGDDMTEPVADETRSLLDGHIVLSRKLSASGHYPAIDIAASASRMMGAVVTPQHKEAARLLQALWTRYEEVELLLRMGEYQRDQDLQADLAIDQRASIQAFLRQHAAQPTPLAHVVQQLAHAVGAT